MSLAFTKPEKFQLEQGDKWKIRPSAMAWRPLTRSKGFSGPRKAVGWMSRHCWFLHLLGRLVFNKRAMRKKQTERAIKKPP